MKMILVDGIRICTNLSLFSMSHHTVYDMFVSSLMVGLLP